MGGYPRREGDGYILFSPPQPQHGSAHNAELGEFEQELLAARRIEIDRGLGVLAHTFHFHHHATTEALMLNDASWVQA